MKEIIRILQEYTSVSSMAFLRLATFKISDGALRTSLGYLLSLRIVRVQQHKEARVYTLVTGWESRLKEAIKDYRVVRPKHLTSTNIQQTKNIGYNTKIVQKEVDNNGIQTT